MLQLFRNIDFSVAIIAFIYFWVFYAANFFCVQPDLAMLANNTNVISTFIFNGVEKSPFLVYVIGFLSILWQSFLLNTLVNEFHLSKKATFITIPAAYIIIFAFGDNDFINPLLLSNNFLVLSLWFLFRTADKKAGLGDIYNSSFLLGLSCVIAWANFAFFPLYILALLILRGFDWREFLVLLAGFFSFFLLLFTYFYLYDSAGAWWVQDVAQHWAVANFDLNISITAWFSIVFFVGLGLFTFINLNNLQQKITLKEQKYIQIVILMLIFGGLSFLMQQNFNWYSLNIFFIPLTILLSLHLQAIKSNNTAEIVHLALFLLAIAAQYQSLLF